ncbi:MAG TPA: hypothetical protein VI488_20100 [Candidatus Angelobacter sp.]
MRRISQLAWFILLASFSLSLHAGDKKKQRYYLKPDQTADLHKINKIVTAKQNCANWGLAAGLESMLAMQKVALDQSFWVMRLNYGELCVEQLPAMELLAKVVNQEFVLDDGRHVRLELHFTAGAPRNIDTMLAGLRSEQLSLLLWHGHPYYLVGATYDEHIGRDGSRLFDVKELRLADTFSGQPGLTFEKGRDNADEIDGILTVSVAQR